MRPATGAAALVGAVTIGATYAAARRAGITTTDLAASLPVGSPPVRRAGQLAIGAIACLPAARSASPRRGLLLGLGGGVLGGIRRRRQPVEVGLSAAAHALAGAVAGAVAARVGRAP